MLNALCVLLADTARQPRPAKFDYGTLTDQMRMELLIQNVEIADVRAIKERKAKMVFLKEKEWSVKDVCQWRSVRCDRDGNVTAIDWYRHYVNIAFRQPGTIELSWLPPLCRIVSFESQRVFGLFDASTLPRKLDTLNLRNNQLTGSVDVTALSDSMVTLELAQNCLTGPLCLQELPERLEVLDLRANAIEQDVVYVQRIDKDLRIQKINIRENKIFAVKYPDGSPCTDRRVLL